LRSNHRPSSWIASSAAAAAVAGAVLLLGGCQAARVDRPLTAELGQSDEDTQLEFWHTLAQQAVTCNDDAFHGLLLFLDGADPAADYAGRVAALKERKLIPANFDQPAEQAVERGTIAVALSRALKIRGGVVMAVTGPSPRYATKELVFLGIYPPSSPNQTFSGTEYLGIIGKAEDYQRLARAGTARPLDSVQVENDVQAGRDMPPSGEPVAPTDPAPTPVAP
jgi:hypothetical protein